MNGHASNRLPVARSVRHDLADTVGRPGTRIIYLRWIHLWPQSPHFGLTHVPASISPENLHFQCLLRIQLCAEQWNRTDTPNQQSFLLAPAFFFFNSVPLLRNYPPRLSSLLHHSVQSLAIPLYFPSLRNQKLKQVIASEFCFVILEFPTNQRALNVSFFHSHYWWRNSLHFVAPCVGEEGWREWGNSMIAVRFPLTRQFRRVFGKRLALLNLDYSSRW